MVFISQLRMRDFSTFNVVLFVQSYKLVYHVFISVVTCICIAAYIVKVQVLSDCGHGRL